MQQELVNIKPMRYVKSHIRLYLENSCTCTPKLPILFAFSLLYFLSEEKLSYTINMLSACVLSTLDPTKGVIPKKRL
jgi:hypothetical protein